MQSVYTFHFLETVSEQLKAKLDELDVSLLGPITLQELIQFQEDNHSRQGVYLVHYNNSPVYVGKAKNVAERLSEHRLKLSGRQGIDLARVGYKALLLDNSMSTAANEDVLIQMYKRIHTGMWNGNGFGPKDPGQHRDTTQPSHFDTMHPIIEDFPISIETKELELSVLLLTMKAQLPYVFRYQVGATELMRVISLHSVASDAHSLLQHIVDFLGVGWKGVILSYGMVLYKTTKNYPFGAVLTSDRPPP